MITKTNHDVHVGMVAADYHFLNRGGSAKGVFKQNMQEHVLAVKKNVGERCLQKEHARTCVGCQPPVLKSGSFGKV